MPTKRRTFLQQVALAGTAAQVEAPAQTPTPAVAAPPATPEIAYPRVFTGRHLTAIAFPLGGVAAGAIIARRTRPAPRLGNLQSAR